MSTATITATVTVAKFTDSRKPLTILRDGVPLKEFERKRCHEGDYHACGSNTPLRDSTARFIRRLDELQAPGTVVVGLLADESGSMAGRDQGVIDGINDFVAGMADVDEVDEEAAGKVLCVIITDGLENASREISPEVLRQLLEEREANGWTFIYLGANQDATATGAGYGLSTTPSGQTVSMASSSPMAFRSALKRTGESHGSSWLASNEDYVETTALSGMSNRLITEDGGEQAVGTPPPASALPPGPLLVPPQSVSVADAIAKARKVTSKDQK